MRTEEYHTMFGKMMNRYYYGKSGKGDYTTEDLPQTRWALFWEMLRVRFSALFRLNLIYMVAWLPAIIVIPGISGSMGLGMNEVRESAKRAIGADILFSE